MQSIRQAAFLRAGYVSPPYADGSFDVIIVANALHIVPEPKKALSLKFVAC